MEVRIVMNKIKLQQKRGRVSHNMGWMTWQTTRVVKILASAGNTPEAHAAVSKMSQRLEQKWLCSNLAVLGMMTTIYLTSVFWWVQERVALFVMANWVLESLTASAYLFVTRGLCLASMTTLIPISLITQRSYHFVEKTLLSAHLLKMLSRALANFVRKWVIKFCHQMNR